MSQKIKNMVSWISSNFVINARRVSPQLGCWLPGVAGGLVFIALIGVIWRHVIVGKLVAFM
jgi:hypothetical protein